MFQSLFASIPTKMLTLSPMPGRVRVLPNSERRTLAPAASLPHFCLATHWHYAINFCWHSG